MRAPTVLLMAILNAAIVLPDAAHAQFSPQGMLDGISRPFRSMLSHFGHFPRHRQQAATVSHSPADAVSASAGSRLGRVGPPAWPSAYEDVLGYAFWPDDYATRLRSRGFDVIADTITGRFETPRATAQIATTGTAVQSDTNANTDCQDTTSAQNDWPSTRLGQTVQLSNAQHNMVASLQTTVTQAAKTFNADCSDAHTMAAPDRLRTLVQSLWSVRDAGTGLRAPLKTFADSLTDAQKTSFISKQPQEAPKSNAKNANPAMNRQYQVCAQPNVLEAERMIKQIELRVRPTKEQAASLENLHKTASDMAKMLMGSCAQPIPADPLARLDAAGDQLTAMNYAATTVQIAFDDFYGKLDNAQKARFEAMGR